MSKLRIEGLLDRPLDLGYAELEALPDQISDVGQVVPGKPGAGVRLAAVLAAAGASAEATDLYLESIDGSFQASIPLSAVKNAVLAYRLDDQPLPADKGGPVRFLTPHEGGCDKADGHACANVKGLALLRLTRS